MAHQATDPDGRGRPDETALLRAVARAFPVRAGMTTCELVGPPTRSDEHGVCATLRLTFQWGAAPAEASVQEGPSNLFSPAELADLPGCLRALEGLRGSLEKRLGTESSLVCKPEEFLPLVLAAPDASRGYGHWARRQPEGDGRWLAALRASIAAAQQHFVAVEEKFRRVYDLPLPRHLSVFVGFMRALREVFGEDTAAATGVRLGWITRWFEPENLRRPPRDGLDERLYGRFWCDPPELVSVAHADSGGLHWGLWYDVPDALPRRIAHSDAWDTGECCADDALTMLDVLAQQSLNKQQERDAYDLGYYPAHYRLRQVNERLIDARDAESEALAEDGLRRVAAPRPESSLGSIRPWLPPGHTRPAGRPSEARIAQLYRAGAPEAEQWLAEARARLALGDAGPALVLGHELHRFEQSPLREQGLALLCAAYGALGRPQLAAVARVHHAHWDLPSVDLYTA